MAGVRSYLHGLRQAVLTAFVVACALPAAAQLPPAGPVTDVNPVDPPAATPRLTDDIVAEILVEGNRTRTTQRVLNEIGTRVGRPYDRDQLQRDVRKLASKTWFLDVKPEFSRNATGGLVITFKVIERPILEYVKYVGNSKVKARKLSEQSELKAGMSRDPYAVEEGRRRIEQYYQERGFNGVQVTILEGTKPNDRGVIYLINEGHSQKISKVVFEGNTIANDSRLKTQIQSKPAILWMFKGQVNRQLIDEDVDRLTAYYRSLGFFRARIGRELEWNEDQNWLTLRFVIDEGPRYQVRNISIIGNTKFETEELTTNLKLKGGEFFDQPKMDADLGTIRDIYGGVGYVFADVQAETRFLEEPGQVDLVYNLAEGKRYRVGRINVKIEGEHTHTRIQTVLNRVSLKPGDIVDIRKLRDSERRLKASGLFLNDPTQGASPRLVIVPPELEAEEELAERPGVGGVRGQSPDNADVEPLQPDDVVVNFGVDGVMHDGVRVSPTLAAPQAALRPEPAPHRPAVRQERELPPPYPVDAPQSQQPLTYRGQSPTYQSPTYQSPTYQRNPAPRNTVALDDYPRDPAPVARRPRNVIPTQFAPSGGGRQLGGMGRPQPYTQAPASAAYAPPANDPYLPPPPATTNLAPSAPVVPPDPYAPPVTGPPTTVAPYVEPMAPPPGYAPPPSGPPGLFGNMFGNNGPVPVDENGFVPPSFEEPDGYLDIDSVVQETQTGRFMFGVGVNSDAGLVGSIVIDEQNFDWRRWPTNGWEDFRNGTAFRGAGQRFRLEAAPGTQVQRYLINFSEPFLFDTPVSLGLSGFYFTRGYTDWLEERLGGGVTLGYQFTPDLTGTIGYTGQAVDISNPRQPTPPALAEVLGNTAIHTFSLQLAHDTRDNTFLSTQGHRISAKLEQTVGDFNYPRATLEGRQFFPIRERPDGSGRHVLSLVGQVGFTGNDTPIYDRYFIGGFSTLRGFRFRGAGPYDMDVNVGGDFLMLGSVEYLFPITADDMLRGVVFCDTGTVEEDVKITDYRVAPGFGLRVTVPALGPAPIALDFAFPVAYGPDDQRQVFSFFVGFGR